MLCSVGADNKIKQPTDPVLGHTRVVAHEAMTSSASVVLVALAFAAVAASSLWT